MRIRILTILVAASAAAQPHAGDGQLPAARTAETVYKNMTELKGTRADQVLPAMQFISASLGVDCSFCHVQDKFEADDKLAKRDIRFHSIGTLRRLSSGYGWGALCIL